MQPFHKYQIKTHNLGMAIGRNEAQPSLAAQPHEAQNVFKMS